MAQPVSPGPIPTQPQPRGPPFHPTLVQGFGCNNNNGLLQLWLVPRAEPDIHYSCRAYRDAACCSADRSKEMVARELLTKRLEAKCWAPYTAMKCAIECDPEAANWQWVSDTEPVLCRRALLAPGACAVLLLTVSHHTARRRFCEDYYSACPDFYDGDNQGYANVSAYCDATAAETSCLRVPLPPPSHPPSPPPSPRAPPAPPELPPPARQRDWFGTRRPGGWNPREKQRGAFRCSRVGAPYIGTDVPDWIVAAVCLLGLLAVCAALCAALSSSSL